MTTLPFYLETKCVQVDDADSEDNLVELATKSSQALGRLYRLHEPRISAYVIRRVGNVHEAEDIVANIFMAMVKHLPKYRSTKAPFTAWLYRIATNEINWFFRKQRLLRMFAPIADIAESRRATSDDSEEVREALSKLPMRYQNVLSLHYLEQLSVVEIADVLGIATGTVKSRLSRGRALLKKVLA